MPVDQQSAEPMQNVPQGDTEEHAHVCQDSVVIQKSLAGHVSEIQYVEYIVYILNTQFIILSLYSLLVSTMRKFH